MKLFVAMVNDRHADPEPYVFTTAEGAIAYAQGWAEGAAYRPADVDDSETPDGWLYYATYSPESDSVWVLEKTLDEPDPS